MGSQVDLHTIYVTQIKLWGRSGLVVLRVNRTDATQIQIQHNALFAGRNLKPLAI